MKRAFDAAMGGMALLALAGVLASACYVRASPPVAPSVAARCPDFSGDYFFPGVDAAEEICPVLDGDLQVRFRWPAPAGGFTERTSKAVIRVRQEGCSAIHFRLMAAGIKPGAWTASRDLERKRQRQHIEWDETSLTYQDRVKAAPSFTLAPINAAKETIFLRREASGALTYRGSYWEATEGRRKVLTECTLRRARTEDWQAVGVEEPGHEVGPEG